MKAAVYIAVILASVAAVPEPQVSAIPVPQGPIGTVIGITTNPISQTTSTVQNTQQNQGVQAPQGGPDSLEDNAPMIAEPGSWWWNRCYIRCRYRWDFWRCMRRCRRGGF